MTEKQFHLKIKWKNKEKTEAHEIVLYDDGQPLCELISVDDARLVRDVLNEQYALIKRLKTIREEQIQTILKQKRKIKELTVQLQTDDICSKCKHEYLVKRDDGYFIAKCKKGHNECSKGDIRFCEDFEFELGGDVKWD